MRTRSRKHKRKRDANPKWVENDANKQKITCKHNRNRQQKPQYERKHKRKHKRDANSEWVDQT